MKLNEKINLLRDKHYTKWIETKEKVSDELSDVQGFRCICGRLATGFHEMNCRRFGNKVASETAKRLKHLLKGE